MKTTPRTRLASPRFEELPKDYTSLCLLLLPRPIHSHAQATDVEAMIDVLAVDEHRLTADQCDYLEMLCDVLETWDHAQSPTTASLEPSALLKLLLEESGQTAADVARAIGVDRSAMTRLLSGERAFTVPQASALAEHFAVAPTSFLNLPLTRQK